MQSTSDIIKILIPAVGGQGGGVMTEWLVTAFLNSGFEVQSISLPGLAQRGGSTAYYIEAYKADTTSSNSQLIFSQYPIPGDIDIILCQEFLELGRVLEQGYGSKKTCIISSTHRIYSTPEKLPVSSGIFSDDKLHNLAIEFSSRFIGLDVKQIAKQNGMDDLAINAILFGALGASKSIALRSYNLRTAIESVGIAVKNNLNAYEIGYDYAMNNLAGSDKESAKSLKYLDEKKITTKRKYREDFIKISDYINNFFPENLHIYLIEAAHILIDYQDPEYAEKYLEKVNKVINADKTHNLLISEQFSKNLALLMSYEDGIRVAELKVKSIRFSNIKEEMKIEDSQIFNVTDYLKPDAYEIYGLMPDFIMSPVIKIIDNTPLKRLKRRQKDITFAQKPKTTSFFGFLRLFLLTKLKPLRPYSHRYANESRVINKYIKTTLDYSNKDQQLGLLAAKSGSLVKGYGDVRRKTVDVFTRFIDNIIWPISKDLRDDPDNNKALINFAEQCLDTIGSESDKISEYEKEMREKILFQGVKNGP